MGKKKKDTDAEFVLLDGDASVIDVPEITVSYIRTTRNRFVGKITSSADVAKFIRQIFNDGEVELQEHFLVLYLTQGNTVIGYYRHSKGGIAGTVADVRIILSVALKCAAVGIVLSHNHPSGNLVPSEADKVITKKIKEAAQMMEIKVLDHIIVTHDNYYSFSDQGLLGLDGREYLPANLQEFVGFVEKDLTIGYKHNKRSIEALAYSLKIKDKTEIKELTELAIVNVARRIAATHENTKTKFEKIVQLYNDQVILSHRTSQSILLQQYSTPAPIAYLMGVFCGLPEMTGWAFEPCAGNGLLTIAGNPRKIIVNEIDYIRNRNLLTQGFLEVTNQDASKEFGLIGQKFNAVITNPPFGTLDEAVDYNGFPIKVLDHLMALRALDTMADNGKAAIIIGGHTQWDELGRVQKGKNRIFFNYLYMHYYVADVMQIDGHKLYSRQGTAFPVRVILIEGRKSKPEGVAPTKNADRDSVIKSFDALY